MDRKNGRRNESRPTTDRSNTDGERRIPSDSEKVHELLTRGSKGDPAVVPKLRHLLDLNPGAWLHISDLAQQAEGAWIKLMTGTDLVRSESLWKRVAKMKKELSRPSASPVELLLVDRVIASWLQVHFAELMLSGALSQDSCSLKQEEHAQGRLDRAQLRYEKSLRDLMAAQRLLPPGGTPLVKKVAVPETDESQSAPPVPGKIVRHPRQRSGVCARGVRPGRAQRSKRSTDPIHSMRTSPDLSDADDSQVHQESSRTVASNNPRSTGRGTGRRLIRRGDPEGSTVT